MCPCKIMQAIVSAQCAKSMQNQAMARVQCAIAVQSQPMASVKCISSAHEPLPVTVSLHEQPSNHLHVACKVMGNMPSVMKRQCQWNVFQNPAQPWPIQVMGLKCPPLFWLHAQCHDWPFPLCKANTQHLETCASCSSEHIPNVNHDHQQCLLMITLTFPASPAP